MTSRMPIIRQMSLLSILIQVCLYFILYLIYKQFFIFDAYLYAFITFILVYFALRYSIARDHRKGVRLYKQKKYELAISCFQKSYAFFCKHSWLDKYRFVFLLSSSLISYTEMALLNIAFCQTQIGEKEKAISSYKKVLEQFENSEMAISALKMLQ
jgi:tetratricopeptide (TPR) repeat protein